MLAWGWAPARLGVPSHGKGYCVRRGAQIQSLHLRGWINWLQMAHMVLIKDYLAAAGSVTVCVSVVVCVFFVDTLLHFVPIRVRYMCSFMYMFMYISGLDVYKQGLSAARCVCPPSPFIHPYFSLCCLAVFSVEVYQQIRE